MHDSLRDVRKDYSRSVLEPQEMSAEPFDVLSAWLEESKSHLPDDYNAMVLSTIDEAGFPQSRVVLLRSMDEGLVFYTNYNSDKGRQLLARPKSSALFFWPDLERQVRITGRCAQVPAAMSDAYFNSRPRASQIGAWVSNQSRPIADRSALDDAHASANARFAAGEVPRPPHWGGFRLTPESIEFWQGRPSRLHDRILYRRDKDAWTMQRLQP